MKKDKEWLKKELVRLKVEADAKNEYGSNYTDEQLAIKRVFPLIDQLDEPEKPVIPQFVADFIRATKPNNSLRLAFEYIAQRKIDNYDDELALWIQEGNSELFASAWLDGYEVEKEKRYQVKIPVTVWDSDASELKERTSFLTYDITSGETRILSTIRCRGDYRTDFTETEIKAIDKRFWAFAEEVTE